MKEIQIHFPLVEKRTITTCQVIKNREKPQDEWYTSIQKKINELSYKKTLLQSLPTEIRMGGFAYPEKKGEAPKRDYGESWTLAGLLLLLGLTRKDIILATGKISIELGKVYVGRVDQFQKKLELFSHDERFSLFIVPSENLADIRKPFPNIRFLSLQELAKEKKKVDKSSEKVVVSVGSSPEELDLLISLFCNHNKKKESTWHLSRIFTPLQLFTISLIVLLTVIAGSIAMVPLPENNLRRKESTVVYDAHGDILRVFRSSKGQFALPYQPAAKVPEKLEKSVLFFEDRQFYHHFGVNPFSVMRALYQNISKGRKFSGASTITMQLARLIKEKDRSFSNKILETLQAFKMEFKYEKEDILRKYLSFCPYGGNVYGYRTASIRYFRKEPAQLTWAESALLAILPNAPGLMHPEKNRNYLIKKRDRLLKKMAEADIINRDEYKQAISENVPKIAWPFETGAWHATRHLKAKSRSHSIETSLLKTPQSKTEKLLKNVAESETSFKHIAAIAVENRTGEVRVWVGSQDFFNDFISGQVDGVLARRPAAGMLQPFLYALSIDRGLLLPDSLILDIPGSFKGYIPTNRDTQYSGLISAKEALMTHRSVPAVRLLDTIGVEDFFTFLKIAGLKTLNHPPEWYQYSLVAGGTDVRLIDLAKLYSGIAREGLFSTLSLEGKREKLPADAKRLVSPGASWLIIDKMMKKEKLYGVEAAVSSTCSRLNKDCWTVAMTPQWTVAYWGGNPRNRQNSEDENLSHLTKLAFETLSYLPQDKTESWFEKPEKSMKEMQACVDTGFSADGVACKKEFRPAPIDSVLRKSLWRDSEGKLIFPPNILKHIKE